MVHGDEHVGRIEVGDLQMNLSTHRIARWDGSKWVDVSEPGGHVTDHVVGDHSICKIGSAWSVFYRGYARASFTKFEDAMKWVEEDAKARADLAAKSQRYTEFAAKADVAKPEEPKSDDYGVW